MRLAALEKFTVFVRQPSQLQLVWPAPAGLGRMTASTVTSQPKETAPFLVAFPKPCPYHDKESLYAILLSYPVWVCCLSHAGTQTHTSTLNSFLTLSKQTKSSQVRGGGVCNHSFLAQSSCSINIYWLNHTINNKTNLHLFQLQVSRHFPLDFKSLG